MMLRFAEEGLMGGLNGKQRERERGRKERHY